MFVVYWALQNFEVVKGGAILTDDRDAYFWFKRARFSGRNEMSYHEDHFDMLGWNFYMMPELATRGVLMMNQFYNTDGTKKRCADVELPYPDLSKFEIYKNKIIRLTPYKHQLSASQLKYEKCIKDLLYMVLVVMQAK